MMWTDQRVVILGLARQGIALARYLVSRGARVTLSDAKPAATLTAEFAALDGLPITYQLGGHPLTLLDRCDLLCLSGGVPIDLPIVLEARRRGLPLSNDSEIFFRACPAPIIGITGSAGKTTTTTLVGEMLQTEFRPSERTSGQHSMSPADIETGVWVGGNIGNPLIGDLDRIQSSDRVVLELSSFQLELMTCSPHIACVTNITPNHLDRHGTMEAYVAAKQHILDFQLPDDWAILCADNPLTRQMKTAARTAWFSAHMEPKADGVWQDKSGGLRIRIDCRGIDTSICHVHDLVLMGEHNMMNVLAACCISALAGASPESMRAVATTFPGVAHRLQFVRELNGVRYYDDSIATAPERLMADLRCFDAPVVLLCGGRDKHLPWSEAVRLMAQRCRHVVLFGELARLVTAEIASQRLPLAATTCDTLDQAVQTAHRLAQSGDVVVLAPGGTSFDAYKDFAERGDHFVQLVRSIADPLKQTE